MDRKKLNRFWNDLAKARRSPQTAAQLQVLAKSVGRRERTGGGHGSMWVTDHFPHRSFPIPVHGSKNVSLGVQKVVLNSLEADGAAWEEVLAQVESAESENGVNENGSR